jgi:Flp pilus assembly protein TadG
VSPARSGETAGLFTLRQPILHISAKSLDFCVDVNGGVASMGPLHEQEVPLKQFLKSTSGSIALVVAIAAVPLMLAAGISVDVARKAGAEAKIQAAADAASLYGVHVSNKSDGWLTKETKKIFLANLEKQAVEYKQLRYSASQTISGSVKVDVQLKLPNAFMQVGNLSDMKINVLSEATNGSDKGVEIAIAFDATNSMGFGSSWSTAMNTLGSVFEQMKAQSGSDNFYATLFPFQDRVNVGTRNASWLNAAAPAGWNGCVEPREETKGTVTWSLDDDTTTSEPFAPSAIGVGGLAARGGGYPHCPAESIVGPTNDVNALVESAKRYSKSGTGRPDVGLAWLWRSLSPKWQGHWGVAGYPASDTKQRRKIAILITDMLTSAYKHEAMADGSLPNNQAPAAALEHMVDICTGMKASGIEVWMLRISGYDTADPYFRACSSGDDHYHVIRNNNDLANVLEIVGRTVEGHPRLVR